ncbi:MAG: 23S rRNA (pseudouridine(1915)-N(3))-methyltransferase RlmH [Bacillota bacterium]
MRHTIVTVGQMRAAHFRAAADEYLRRIRPHARVEMISVTGERNPRRISAAAKREVVERESERLSAAVGDGHAFTIALDERGRQMSSVSLARLLARQGVEGRSHAAWFVGGPLGLSQSFIRRCQLHLSLSALTFPHEMVPVILLEQIYRAGKIQRGEPYHY